MPNEGGERRGGKGENLFSQEPRPTGNLCHRSCSISSSPFPVPACRAFLFDSRCRFIRSRLRKRATFVSLMLENSGTFQPDLRKSEVAKSSRTYAPFVVTTQCDSIRARHESYTRIPARKFSERHAAEKSSPFPPPSVGGFVTPAFCSLQSEIWV